MKRRDFLRWASMGGLGTAVGGLGLQLIPKALATHSNQPLWIHLHAGGGWDPTVFCDPRPEVNRIAFDVASSSPTQAGHVFSYADLGGSGATVPGGSGFSTASFFDSYKEQLLVINGIHAGTAGHLTGGRYAASGRLQGGYPALASMVGAVHGSGLGMPYIGGSAVYSVTNGHVTTTRLSANNSLGILAIPNAMGNAQSPTYFYAENEYRAVRAAKAARIQRQIAAETRADTKLAMDAWQRVNQELDRNLLADFVAAYETGAHVSLPAKTNNNALAHGIFKNSLKAIIAYEQNMASAASLGAGVFDTHHNHDLTHPRDIGNLLQALDWTMQECALRSVPVVIFVTSEFGRTAGYNVDDGKDHWPITSWILLQSTGLSVFAAGRVVGASSFDQSSHQIHADAIDKETLQPSTEEDATWINPESLHLGLRRLCDIENHRLSNSLYPLKGWAAHKIFSG